MAATPLTSAEGVTTLRGRLLKQAKVATPIWAPEALALKRILPQAILTPRFKRTLLMNEERLIFMCLKTLNKRRHPAHN
jgi:hypothetical protein